MKKAEIFINELSLDLGDYADETVILEVLSEFYNILRDLQNHHNTTIVWANTENLGINLKDFFEVVEDRNIAKNIKLKMEKLHDWTENPKQDNQAEYFFVDFLDMNLKNIKKSTLAEVSERCLLYQENTNFLVLNFQKSKKYPSAEKFSILKTKYRENVKHVLLENCNGLNLKNWIKVYAEWQELISEKEVFEEIKNKFFEGEKYLNFDWGNWQPNKDFPDNLLPFKEVSDVYVQNFREQTRNMSRGEIKSIINKAGKIVAIINGYKFDKEVSGINEKGAKREIYSAGESNHIIYLSVDFEHGGFEVCNHTGEWQGEYSFSGKNTSNPKDKSMETIYNHSIKIKK